MELSDIDKHSSLFRSLFLGYVTPIIISSKHLQPCLMFEDKRQTLVPNIDKRSSLFQKL